MSETREKAIKLGKVKSVREQSDIWVYYDESSEDDHYVSPHELDKEDYKLIDKFESDISDEESDQIVEVNDYSELEPGDQVLVDSDESQEVVKTSERQIITIDNKFRKSDGIEWGTGKNGKKITHKILI